MKLLKTFIVTVSLVFTFNSAFAWFFYTLPFNELPGYNYVMVENLGNRNDLEEEIDRKIIAGEIKVGDILYFKSRNYTEIEEKGKKIKIELRGYDFSKDHFHVEYIDVIEHNGEKYVTGIGYAEFDPIEAYNAYNINQVKKQKNINPFVTEISVKTILDYYGEDEIMKIFSTDYKKGVIKFLKEQGFVYPKKNASKVLTHIAYKYNKKKAIDLLIKNNMQVYSKIQDVESKNLFDIFVAFIKIGEHTVS